MRRTDNPAPSTIRGRRMKERERRGQYRIDGYIETQFLERMLDGGAIGDKDSRSRKRIFQAIIRLASNALDSSIEAGDTFTGRLETDNARTSAKNRR